MPGYSSSFRMVADSTNQNSGRHVWLSRPRRVSNLASISTVEAMNRQPALLPLSQALVRGRSLQVPADDDPKLYSGN